MTPPRRLLVRLPNPLGDAVLATPALRALRRALPDTHVTWCGRRAPLQALDGLEDRDAVMPVSGPRANGILGPWRLGRFWRRRGFDAVLLLVHAFSAALAARVSGARTRVGSGREGGFLLTQRVALPTENGKLLARPMEEMYLDLVRTFGTEDDADPPRVATTAFDRRRALARVGDAAPDGWFCVNPGAAFGPTKIYPPDRLGAAARGIREETGLVPLVVCGPGEEDLARKVASVAGAPCLVSLPDPPDVGELKGLLAGAALCVTTDAGPRHLAEALGTPTVVVMGPTDPAWTGRSPAAVVQNTALDCLGCHRTRCPIDHPCMEALDPALVVTAARERLAAARRDPPFAG